MNDFSEQSKNDTTDICRNFAKSRDFVLWKSKGIRPPLQIYPLNI